MTNEKGWTEALPWSDIASNQIVWPVGSNWIARAAILGGNILYATSIRNFDMVTMCRSQFYFEMQHQMGVN